MSSLPQVPVEVSANPRPLAPQEAGDDWVLQQVPVEFGLADVPQGFGFRQGVVLTLIPATRWRLDDGRVLLVRRLKGRDLPFGDV